MGKFRLATLGRTQANILRSANGDDRHGHECHRCGYFDTLRSLGGLGEPRYTALVARHIREDHEPVG